MNDKYNEGDFFYNEVEIKSTVTSGGLAESNNETNDDSNIQENDSEIRNNLLPAFNVSIHNLKHNNRAIHFYTGLESFEKFKFVFNTLGPAVNFMN